MTERDIESAVRAANPVEPRSVERTELDTAWGELLQGIVAEPQEQVDSGGTRSRLLSRWHSAFGFGRRRLALGATASVATVLAVVAVAIGLGSAGTPTAALGAGLAHLAKVSPNVLLDLPGWKAEASYKVGGELGVIRFHRVHGGWVEHLGGRLEIFTAQSAQLAWRAASPTSSPRRPRPDAVFVGTGRALGTKTRIYARPTRGRADREYLALWSRSGRELELRSDAQSLESFEQRLFALRLVDRDAWIEALPGRHIVKAGDWVASGAWGEPAASAIVVSRCDVPLPDSVLTHASGSQVRIYERQCGNLRQGSVPSAERPRHEHSKGRVIARCDFPSEEASLQATNAMVKQLEAEGRCRTY